MKQKLYFNEPDKTGLRSSLEIKELVHHVPIEPLDVLVPVGCRVEVTVFDPIARRHRESLLQTAAFELGL